MLKVDLHTHTDLDPLDGKNGVHPYVKHTVEDLVAHASALGYDAVALTHHKQHVYPTNAAYLEKKYGVLIIPGVEIEIHGMHVLLINTTQDWPKTFEDLAKFKSENPQSLIIAPHPYYPGRICLHQNLVKYIHLFDAIEYSHMYHKYMNLYNKKALLVAKKYNKPVVGTGDVHYLSNMGKTYALVDSLKDVASICAAVKAGKCAMSTTPLNVRQISSSFIKTLGAFAAMIFK
jgi:predicted metal-dependent phosphoesterase TrpH